METISIFNDLMIAPCGINCGTCMAHLRDSNKCPGCRIADSKKLRTRNLCRIKNCLQLAEINSGFCYECGSFPCDKMKHIDKRYRLKYKTSLIQNLLTLKETGMTNYLILETEKWTCPNCGVILSVHRNFCMDCNQVIDRTSQLS
ncbi:MAG: DUF3795 domain-containing protein [Bacteroidales bacterium]|jgi:rubredoxin